MEKHSKVTRQATPVETIGIDLGDKISRYAIVDEMGNLMEEGKFHNQAESIRKHFGQGMRARVAIEVGSQSAWIARELKQLGHEVIVANARQVKWITASDQKNDRVDALKLARLARVDTKLLAPVEHRSEQQQAELSVIRARDAVVRARALLVNAARGMAKGIGHRMPKAITSTFGVRTLQVLPAQLRPALEGLLQQIDQLSAAIQGYDEAIAQLIERHAEVKRLKTIRGVGPLTAMTFVLTVGSAERFAHSRDVASYLGLRPKQKQSGTCDPQLGIAKSGNKYLRKLLVQCAHHVLGRFGIDSSLRRWGLVKSEGSKNAKKRAIVAVARKLAVLLHRLWVTGETYKPFPQMG
jgi:transposase